MSGEQDIYSKFYALCRTGTPETRTPEVNAEIAALTAVLDADQAAADTVIELSYGLTNRQRQLVISALVDQIAAGDEEETP